MAKITEETKDKVRIMVSKGVPDGEIAEFFGLNMTTVFNLSTNYWEKKMQSQLIQANKEANIRPRSRQVILKIGENKGIAVLKCDRCTVIRDLKEPECKHC